MSTEAARERKRRYAAKKRQDPEWVAQKNAERAAWRAQPEVRERLRQEAVERRSMSDKTTTDESWLRMLRLRGLTPEIYHALVEFQDGRCAICPATVPWSRGDRWMVDHDHETGEVRGLLCAECNAGLGKLGDTVQSLRLALHYLENPTYARYKENQKTHA